MKQVKTEKSQEINFKGLNEAAQDFNPFEVISYLTDPGYGYYHVKLLLIKFKKDQIFGLCIYDTAKKQFIEEPSDLDDYGFESINKVYEKYPQLKK